MKLGRSLRTRRFYGFTKITIRRMNRSFAAALIIGCFAFLTACGGGGESGPPSSPPSEPPPESGPGGTPTSSVIASARPALNDSNVSIYTDVAVTLTQDLDVDSVDTTTVFLLGKWSITGAVSYEPSTRTIVFQPHSPLDAKTTYHLILAGVKNTSGDEIHLMATRFQAGTLRVRRTADGVWRIGEVYNYNDEGAPTNKIRYSAGPDRVLFNDDDIVLGYTLLGQDAATGLEGSIEYGDSGRDGVWFTPDDGILRCSASKYIYENDGTTKFWTMNCEHIGADRAWFTDDDAITSHDKGVIRHWPSFSISTERDSVTYVAPGPDNQWLTDDDVPGGYRLSTFNIDGELVKRVIYQGSGPDGVWFNSDDDVSSYWRLSNYGEGKPKSVTYSGPGVDGVWFTSDDAIAFYDATSTGGQGWQLTVHFQDAGLDGIWFTEDDESSSCHVLRSSLWASYFADCPDPGADGIRLTQDDRFMQYSMNMTDVLGRYKQVTYNDPGPDDQWITSDDTVYSYTTSSWEIHGAHPRSISYVGPGTDGVWFTNDDQISHYTRYIVSDGGLKITHATYDEPGPDGQWFTADDSVDYLNETEYEVY